MLRQLRQLNQWPAPKQPIVHLSPDKTKRIGLKKMQ